MLEGFRREVTVSDLCRREGIKPHSYYAWTKECRPSAIVGQVNRKPPLRILHDPQLCRVQLWQRCGTILSSLPRTDARHTTLKTTRIPRQ